jgi:hypothetical protein
MIRVSISQVNETTLLGEFATKEDAYQAISDDIDSTGFKSFYWRTNTLEEGEVWLDYGSHSRFYLIEQIILV